MIYTIADTHLSFSTDKPMDVFGFSWENHTERLREAWNSLVRPEDTVIIPGDISWATDLDDAYADFDFINRLPGRKIIGKGNHDYWWSSMKKLNDFKERYELSTIDFLFNNAYVVEDKIICGTRGWVKEFGVKEEDERIIKREANRLILSLDEGLKLKEQYPENEIIVFLHYPPLFGEFMNYDIIDVLYRYDIKKVYFGHLHNVTHAQLDDSYLGMELHLVAGDYVEFVPQRVE